jgi:hypothetical protein
LLGSEKRHKGSEETGEQERPDRAGGVHDRLDEVGDGGFQGELKLEIIDMRMFLLQNAGNKKNAGTSVQWT